MNGIYKQQMRIARIRNNYTCYRIVSPRTCRTFFGASKSSLVEFSEKRLVGYSAAQMYSLVANVNDYHHFVPWCVGSQVKTTQKFRVPGHKIQTVMLCDLSVGFKAFKEKYTSRVICIENESVMAKASDSAVFKNLVNEWKFTPATSHHHHSRVQSPSSTSVDYPSCYLDFYVAFEFNSLVYAQLSTLFLDEVSKMMVGAFEKRARELYGQPSVPSLKLSIDSRKKT